MKAIIGLTGLPRTGKDTIADYLVKEYGFTKFAFADALYKEVAEAFGVTIEQLKSEEWKTEHQDALVINNCGDIDFHKVYCSQVVRGRGWLSDRKVTSRKILQMWGTEYRRDTCGKDYWLHKLGERIREEGTPDRVVLSDIRFDNEAAYCYAMGNDLPEGITNLWRVERGGAIHTGHSSDDHISPLLLSERVVNSSTVEHLERAVDSIMRKHSIPKREALK